MARPCPANHSPNAPQTGAHGSVTTGNAIMRQTASLPQSHNGSTASASRRTAIAAIAAAAITGALGHWPAHAQTATNNGQQAANPAPAHWHEQLKEFEGELQAAADLPSAWVRRILSQVSYNAKAKRLMTPARNARSTVPDWQQYRARLVTTARIDAGLQFWRQHGNVLEQVAQRTGVPADVIVGIIGIETFYGRNTGDIRVLDALATLAFDYPQNHPRAQERAKYFRQELEQFLRLCLEHKLDPLALRGSFAGALGIPQFMPSNWILYGEDQNRDGRVDLLNTPADAIASVANYLRAHGWKPGVPAWYPIMLTADEQGLQTLLKPDILPTFDVQGMAQLGAHLGHTGRDHSGLLALVKLRNGPREPEYIAGTENFYAVTRYNQSSYYALAVLELGEAVARRMATAH